MDLVIRLREWGRRGGDVSATPTLPTARLLDAPAADLIQRPEACAVSIKRRLNKLGAAGGLSIPLTAPVGRLGTHRNRMRSLATSCLWSRSIGCLA
jgi:hypothetical protein